jgi:hypothetical protein
MTDQWLHKFTSTRACPTAGYGKQAIITVEAGLHKLQGNDRPYFSVTAQIASSRRWIASPRACGCLHDEIAKYYPKLAPIIALHLCDDTGTPMHAEANAWYWLAGYYGGAGERYHGGGTSYDQRTPEQCLQVFADHVRLPIEEARTIAEALRCDDDPASSKRWLNAWISTQAGRWQAEATAGIALLDTLKQQQADRKAAQETASS